MELFVIALAVFLGWYLGVRSERLSTRAIERGGAPYTTEWFRDLCTWASEAIDALNEAGYFASGSGEFAAERTETAMLCRQRLSALVDRGRLFVPEPDIGSTPGLRRGRHPALGYLVAAERVLAGTGRHAPVPALNAVAAIVALKRGFVAEIQDILEPRSRDCQIADRLRSTCGELTAAPSDIP
jgi:hypothetical protein